MDLIAKLTGKNNQKAGSPDNNNQQKEEQQKISNPKQGKGGAMNKFLQKAKKENLQDKNNDNSLLHPSPGSADPKQPKGLFQKLATGIASLFINKQQPAEIPEHSIFQSFKQGIMPSNQLERQIQKFKSELQQLIQDYKESMVKYEITPKKRFDDLQKIVEAMGNEPQLPVGFKSAIGLLKKEIPKLMICKNEHANDILKRISNFKIKNSEIPKYYPEMVEMIMLYFEQFNANYNRKMNNVTKLHDAQVEKINRDILSIEEAKKQYEEQLVIFNKQNHQMEQKISEYKQKYVLFEKEKVMKIQQNQDFIDKEVDKLITENCELTSQITTIELENQDLKRLNDQIQKNIKKIQQEQHLEQQNDTDHLNNINGNGVENSNIDESIDSVHDSRIQSSRKIKVQKLPQLQQVFHQPSPISIISHFNNGHNIRNSSK